MSTKVYVTRGTVIKSLHQFFGLFLKKNCGRSGRAIFSSYLRNDLDTSWNFSKKSERFGRVVYHVLLAHELVINGINVLVYFRTTIS